MLGQQRNMENNRVQSHWVSNWDFKDYWRVLGHWASAQVRLIITLQPLLLPRIISCLNHS